MPRLLTAPLHYLPLFLSPHTKTPSQVEALIRASGNPSESPGMERGIEGQEKNGGKGQEVGEEKSRDRFDKCVCVYVGGILFITAGLISYLHFTAFHRYFTEC